MRSLATLSPLLGKLDRAAQIAYGLAALIATAAVWGWAIDVPRLRDLGADFAPMAPGEALAFLLLASSFHADRKSTRLNSSHLGISYAVFCLKKKKKHQKTINNSSKTTQTSRLPV